MIYFYRPTDERHMNILMKLKIIFPMLCLFLISGTVANAQYMTIRFHDGTENVNELNSIQKLSFMDGNLLLAFKSGSIESYGLSTVQKLYFDSQTSISEYNSNDLQKLLVYPDPAGNEITVQNIASGLSLVFIYSVDGQLLLKTKVSPDASTIDVSNLEKGLYLLLANGTAVKFVKL
jgi:hypothetical protein